MPSRVIDVGEDANGVHSNPYLVDSTIESAPYVALSYCWGSASNTLKTTRENIEKQRKSIPLLSLPQVYPCS